MGDTQDIELSDSSSVARLYPAISSTDLLNPLRIPYVLEASFWRTMVRGHTLAGNSDAQIGKNARNSLVCTTMLPIVFGAATFKFKRYSPDNIKAGNYGSWNLQKNTKQKTMQRVVLKHWNDRFKDHKILGRFS